MSHHNMWAFIDECGNDGMDFTAAQVSTHFIITSIVVSDNDYGSLKEYFDIIRAKNFKDGSEMKSRTIGDDNEKRKLVLGELANANFGVYVLVIDKTKLTSPGFRYSKSFLKYLHMRLYNHIAEDFHFVHIRADKNKNPRFMQELREYFGQQLQMSLWQKPDFDFEDSKENSVIQAADIVSGSIARGYETKVNSSTHNDFVEILRDRIRSYSHFPLKAEPSVNIAAQTTQDFDDAIEARALALAEDFISDHSKNDNPEILVQLHCLQAILTRNYAFGLNDWISTPELQKLHLEAFGEDLSDQALRGIIGKLRSAGVLIASRSVGGYKIPTCVADIHKFLDRQNSQISPMMHRVKIARQTIQRATNNRLDILENYARLKKAIDASPDWAIEDTSDIGD